MRIASLLLAATAACCFASSTFAQIQAVPNTGCSDGSTLGSTATLVGTPTIPIAPPGGSNQFAIQTQCGIGTAAFMFWGLADAGGAGAPTAFNWPIGNPCFAGFTNPPAFCNGILNPLAGELVGNISDAAGDVTVNWPFPVADLRPAFDLEAFFAGTLVPGVGPIAFQLLCVDLSSGACLSVSQAYTVRLTYS